MAALREIGVSLGAAFGIMVIVEFEWSTDVAQAEWWVRALRGFAVDVGSIVPATFPAYARVFHRTSDGERWADVAAANGRVAHAEMQYHEIRRPIGAPPVDDTSQLEYSGALGTMDHDELLVLAEVLGRHTSTPHLWCCVWEGFAQLHGGAAVGRLSSTGDDDHPFEGIVPVGLRSAPKVEIPGRAYYCSKDHVPRSVTCTRSSGVGRRTSGGRPTGHGSSRPRSTSRGRTSPAARRPSRSCSPTTASRCFGCSRPTVSPGTATS
jgi:hypothetical protein